MDTSASPAISQRGDIIKLAEDVAVERGFGTLVPSWEAPEDRSKAEPSEFVGIDYIQDYLRPNRLHLIAAEEGTGKSLHALELALRVAVPEIADQRLAGYFQVNQQGHGAVLYASEMSADEDFEREEMLLAALGIERDHLEKRYYRINLDSAAGGQPILDTAKWREQLVEWANKPEIQLKLLVIDTATMATGVEPWGQDLTSVKRNLTAIINACQGLAIVLLVHMKKPAGRAGNTNRQLHEVLGDWGKWMDIVILLESEGQDRVKLSTRKRLPTLHRLILTKRDGLLVDPIDLDDPSAIKPSSKISEEGQMAVIETAPGISVTDFANRIGVTKPTARAYVEKLKAGGLVLTTDGPRKSVLVFPANRTPVQATIDELGA
jgi:hypothetical protein